jgi:hypothetical protein
MIIFRILEEICTGTLGQQVLPSSRLRRLWMRGKFVLLINRCIVDDQF